MGKHDPANIFIVAEQFRSADKMLHMILRGELTAGGQPVPFEVSAPMVTCAAFAFELYLKCLVSMETGFPPPNTHKLDHLFAMLYPDTQTEIRKYFDANGTSTIAYIKNEFDRAGKPAPTIDFDYVLRVSGRAFPIARYLYEGLPGEEGWVAEIIMEGARAIILKRWPAWGKARQVAPAVVLDGPPIFPTH